MKRMRKRLGALVLLLAVMTGLFTFAVAASEAGAGEGSLGFTAQVGRFFEAHLTEFFSALSLGGSLLLAVVFRVSLLPALRGSVGRIGASAKVTEKSAVETAKALEEAREEAKLLLSPISEQLEQTRSLAEGTVDECAQIGALLSEWRKEQVRLREVLLGQTEMLYGALQSAALPQYRKDALGEEYLRMKRALGALEEEGEGGE